MVDLSHLNPQQRLAAETTEGQVLILAGAGSGKTNTLMHRIANILDQGKAYPSEILVVTFTNKAAGEMKERIAKILSKQGGHPINMPWMGTFHSVCVKILRREAHNLGFNSNFSIYDPSDQLEVVKQCLEKLGRTSKEIKPQAVHSYISFAKNELISATDYVQYAQGYFQQIVAEVYPLYQQILKSNNAMDFDDLLMNTVRLFELEPLILQKYQEQFKYIMVDEYQDTNHAQYKLMNLIAQGHQNICCVGDDDQSIYAFRGATIRNILNFEKDYPQAVIIKLEQNYRSTQKILNASYHVISKNKSRKEKKLWTNNAEGTNITLYRAEHEFDEGRWVAQMINQAVSEGENLQDIAVLYRTNAQSRTLEEQFLRESINYRVVGGIRFYDRKEIKDVLAYLRVVYNPQDDGSLRRIINLPKRGIGAKAINDLGETAAAKGMSVIEFLLNFGPDVSSKNIAEFAILISKLHKMAHELNVVELINNILEMTGYLKMLQDGTLENESRVENIKELISVAAKFAELEAEASLAEFLNEVALFESPVNEEADVDRVTLMTIHAAKGLEFNRVFVVGMEEGLFPHSRVYTDPKELEEERRLAYVAITRAKKHLYFTHTESRTYFGKRQSNMISRFIDDIDEDLIEKRSYRLGSFDLGGWEERKSDDDYRQDFDFEEVVENKSTSKPAEVITTKISVEVGDKVKHDYFGVGTVQKVNEGKAIISFGPVYGVKELMLEYAPLKKL